jgi:hypothetical protein
MSFLGNESEVITLQEATDWTANYRQTISASDVRAHFFGKTKLLDLLDQDECVGVRIYYALDDSGAKQLVMVGADQNEEDLYEGIILERARPCPSFCATNSPLNE